MIAGWGAVAGSVFIILSGIALFVNYLMKRNKKKEEARREAIEAIDSGDASKLLSALRRLLNS